MAPAWDAFEKRPELLEVFQKTGSLDGLKANTGARKPAAAICLNHELPAKGSATATFYFLWWMPEHWVEQRPVQAFKKGNHRGQRVGHFYENHFERPESLAHYVHENVSRLWEESVALPQLVEAGTLPGWLQNALINASDSVICNAILPKAGKLYTLEGMDWGWFYGGLTGTNDQRLSAHPFTATFFPELDKTEVDSFRQLSRDGEVPHGNGNCDLSLGTAEVPYGWPVYIAGSLAEDRRPDFILSDILQTYRLGKTTGDTGWLQSAWPDMLKMLDKLKSWSRHGIPEGGTTYDTFTFPGTFMYTATLYVTALRALKDLAHSFQPEKMAELEALKSEAVERIEKDLWNAAGGYYQTTENRDTLFVGSLAGDWFARYAGLPPAVPPEKARQHMRKLYELLFKEKDLLNAPSAYPNSEVRPDGKVVNSYTMGFIRVLGYAYQVVSYVGLELVYLGLVEEGLAVIEVLYDRIWQKGYPWSADLWGNAGAVYMTHPVLWALPYALTGAFLDVEKRCLTLSASALQHGMAVPVCFPSCWLLIRPFATESQIEIEVRRHFREPLAISHLSLSDQSDEPQKVDITGEMKLEAGRIYHLSRDSLSLREEK